VATPWDLVARSHGVAFPPDGRAFAPPTFTRDAPVIPRRAPRTSDADYVLERTDHDPFEVAPGVSYKPTGHPDMRFMARLVSAKKLADAQRDACQSQYQLPTQGDKAMQQFRQANAVRAARSFDDKVAAFKKVNDDGSR
jgi:hypothetical protein